MSVSGPPERAADWSRAGHDRRQARLGLDLTPAERLRWLEETVARLATWVGRARRPGDASATPDGEHGDIETTA